MTLQGEAGVIQRPDGTGEFQLGRHLCIRHWDAARSPALSAAQFLESQNYLCLRSLDSQEREQGGQHGFYGGGAARPIPQRLGRAPHLRRPLLLCCLAASIGHSTKGFTEQVDSLRCGLADEYLWPETGELTTNGQLDCSDASVAVQNARKVGQRLVPSHAYIIAQRSHVVMPTNADVYRSGVLSTYRTVREVLR